MAEITVSNPQWRQVEVGRVVVLPDEKLAAIVEIIDHKRVLVDGPSADPKLASSRQAISLSKVFLSPLVIEKLPKKSRTGTVRKAWEAAEIDSKWARTNWAKKWLRIERRKALTDFDRFKVMRLKKQRRWEVRKALAKVKAAA